ncbi:extracellular solute-binding protein [Nocardioides bizhenqiangii]|uniref:Extracellular solute-binding protein n=1 Tax=Nocardioides bizhenqiangii TaxID=3095076 RepID=A0ABZ0ZSV8_9ACTN|nr:extracellular solute-binding protein [Nocardioides sp. HM61]WQQ27367.1 extracellular solute-binding protein [Nocardioides sp. HM61]
MFSLARFDWRTFVAVVVVAVSVVVAMVLYSDGDGPPPNGGHGPTQPSSGMSRLVFAVWGNETEIEAYRKIVADYNEDSVVVDVHVEAWPDSSSMLADIRSGDVAPDLYMLPREELAETLETERNRPVLDLLDARGVAFGDEFPREALSAFTADDNLQCMPYTSSPMVIYYNTDLIDFERMAARDLPVPPEDLEYWTLDMFRAAAAFASRPRKESKGVYIEPTMRGLAPFVYAGGGSVFDDDTDPTSLALSDEDNVDSIRETLEVLRDPTITLTNKQLREESALHYFESGELGMIAGFRDLTPRLRQVAGLNFDVMPMPELDDDATIGDLAGVCVAEGPQERVEQSADFLVNLLSDEAVTTMAATGYLMPTKLDVSFSDAFLQPDLQPANSRAFVSSIRSIVLPPLLAVWPDLEAAVDPDLERLLTQPSIEDLEAELEAIDEKSQTVLDPEQPEESEDPSESVSPSD